MGLVNMLRKVKKILPLGHSVPYEASPVEVGKTVINSALQQPGKFRGTSSVCRSTLFEREFQEPSSCEGVDFMLDLDALHRFAAKLLGLSYVHLWGVLREQYFLLSSFCLKRSSEVHFSFYQPVLLECRSNCLPILWGVQTTKLDLHDTIQPKQNFGEHVLQRLLCRSLLYAFCVPQTLL